MSIAEHGDSPEPRLEGLVDVRGRMWAYNDVADAYTLPPGQVENLAARGLRDDVSWFGSEQIGDYASLIGPFTEVRI